MSLLGVRVLALLALTLSVCPAQILPSFNSTATAAKVIARQGQVSIARDAALWAIDVGDNVQARQVIVTGPDGYAAFEVSDGSTFEVFANSQVTFRANSGSLRDLADVWLGRIRVHIQRMGGKPNPNKVHTPTAIISVRGTTFDVEVGDDDETTRVAVEEGQVAVEHRLMPRDGDPRVLNEGDEILVYRNAPLASSRRVDRGRMLQIMAEAARQILIRMPVTIGGGSPGGVPGPTGGGAPLPGDTGATPPPPPPSAPAPPPPPPGGN
jgi:ferric-dicitrate binding protein FerR (iron transport regulator)